MTACACTAHAVAEPRAGVHLGRRIDAGRAGSGVGCSSAAARANARYGLSAISRGPGEQLPGRPAPAPPRRRARVRQLPAIAAVGEKAQLRRAGLRQRGDAVAARARRRPSTRPPTRCASSLRRMPAGSGLGRVLEQRQHLVGDVQRVAGVDHAFVQDEVVAVGLGELLDRRQQLLAQLADLLRLADAQVVLELVLGVLELAPAVDDLALLGLALVLAAASGRSWTDPAPAARAAWRAIRAAGGAA